MSWFAENWLSFVSVSFALIMGVLAIVKDIKKDSKTDAEEVATIRTDIATIKVYLEGIQSGIHNLNCETKNVKAEVAELSTRLTVCEESVKTARRDIDKILKLRGV